MLGSALFTTVTSSSSMNTAMQTTPSVHHLLPRSVGVVVASRWVVDMGAHRRGSCRARLAPAQPRCAREDPGGTRVDERNTRDGAGRSEVTDVGRRRVLAPSPGLHRVPD